jgi:transcriptional regulator with XRE-family HTH domain
VEPTVTVSVVWRTLAFSSRRSYVNISDILESPMAKQNKNGKSDGDAQLRWHRLHLGLYARVARRMGVNPSYVSRVATGKRQSSDIKKAILRELGRIKQIAP